MLTMLDFSILTRYVAIFLIVYLANGWYDVRHLSPVDKRQYIEDNAIYIYLLICSALVEIISNISQ